MKIFLKNETYFFSISGRRALIGMEFPGISETRKNDVEESW
jgi:hypothetical protein